MALMLPRCCSSGQSSLGCLMESDGTATETAFRSFVVDPPTHTYARTQTRVHHNACAEFRYSSCFLLNSHDIISSPRSNCILSAPDLSRSRSLFLFMLPCHICPVLNLSPLARVLHFTSWIIHMHQDQYLKLNRLVLIAHVSLPERSLLSAVFAFLSQIVIEIIPFTSPSHLLPSLPFPSLPLPVPFPVPSPRCTSLPLSL
jgi:hypothetical protein